MIAFLLVCLFLVIVLVGIYNSLIQKKNAADFAFSCIDVQLKKRFDLIPNLVETVKAYAKHEEKVLSEVIKLRTMIGKSKETSSERFSLEDTMTEQLPTVIALAESYPDLKADKQFMYLQRMLSEIEEQISAARRTFNASIYTYNNAVQSFPSNMIAGMFGFKIRDFFSIAEEQKVLPKIES